MRTLASLSIAPAAAVELPSNTEGESLRGTLALLLLLLVPACSGADDDGLETGRYVSESVTAEDDSLFAGDEVTLKMRERDEQAFVVWEADCNIMEAPVHIRDGRLVASQDETRSSLRICDERRTAQDAWLEEFFTSSPLWEQEAGGLRVQSLDGARSISFERKGDDPSPASSDTPASEVPPQTRSGEPKPEPERGTVWCVEGEPVDDRGNFVCVEWLVVEEVTDVDRLTPEIWDTIALNYTECAFTGGCPGLVSGGYVWTADDLRALARTWERVAEHERKQGAVEERVRASESRAAEFYGWADEVDAGTRPRPSPQPQPQP